MRAPSDQNVLLETQGASSRILHPALSPPEPERVFGVDWGRWDVRRERSRCGPTFPIWASRVLRGASLVWSFLCSLGSLPLSHTRQPAHAHLLLHKASRAVLV